MFNLKEYQQTKFYGMNNTTAPSSLKGFEAVDVCNFIIRYQGKLVRRNGQTEIGTDAGTTGVNNITKYINGSTNVSIKAIDKTIKKFSAGSWSNLGAAPTFTSTGPINFCAADYFIYAFNGTDDPKKLTDTTSGDVTTIPKGSWAVWYRNYMIVGGVTAYPNRIYISDLGDPETYGASSYIDIEPGDGDSLTGGIVAGPDKVFFTKNKTIHYMTGAGSDTFAVYPLTRDFGIVSHRSLVNVGEDVWGVKPDGRIMSLLKTQYGLYSGKDMSSDFLEETTNNVNQTVLSKSVSAFVNGYVIVGMATGASTTNNTVLVYDTLAPITSTYSKWTRISGWDINALDVNDVNGMDELFMGNSANDKVSRWFGNQDFTTNISASWIGPEWEFDSLGTPKRFRQIKAIAYPLGNYDFDFYASIDNGTYTNIGSLNLTSTGGTWGTSVWGSFLWGSIGDIRDRFHFSTNSGKVNGFKSQIKILYSENSDEPTLGAFSVYYSPRRWR